MSATTSPGSRWAGYLLGFSLGGFFDGILLHQILQWHHLLSAINSDDLRFQVAADGYFHAFMYVVAGAGLWMLWRSWRGGGAVSGIQLTAALLLGFGAWHVLDSLLSHWLLGIHRIRMDSASPLFWDLLWFVVFGLVPILLGWWMGSRPTGGSPGKPSVVAAALATLATVGAGTQALQPPRDREFTTVLFAPGTAPGAALEAMSLVGGRLVWSDPSGELLVIETDPGTWTSTLYRHGAILVSGAGLPAGCFDYLRV
ncbi:DUF2243 domain-containing protein [Aurantimonas aggregata]|uniref:DUF2243 domain-containing protein n=1 Tax=Aurantimonas aggregata TaxID=2047720 RepID=A0A6L9MBN0_9HYPH|nr:DUF2243 domain-containing protein [Aurantimonas aggregata]